jgi:DNA (cytosine-5)-methyltransferase 1
MGMGCEQYEYEPSRLINKKTPEQPARIRALGNAVVPNQAYPIFTAIREVEQWI